MGFNLYSGTAPAKETLDVLGLFPRLNQRPWLILGERMG